MAYYQHAELLLLHSIQKNPPDLGLTDRIQHGRDLIGNDKGGLRGQGTGNGQSLELAAGKLMGIAVEPGGFDPQSVEQGRSGLRGFGQRPA